MLSEIVTDVVVKSLKDLNLSDRHALVYLALLEEGKTDISKISKTTGIPRSTIYILFSDLINIGLVTYITGQSKAIYSPEPPQKLLDLLEKKANETKLVGEKLKNSIEILQSKYSAISENLPSIRFYQGNDILKTVLYDSFKYGELFITCIELNIRENKESYEDEMVDDCTIEHNRRGIKCKEILYNSEINKDFAKKFTTDFHEFRFINDLNVLKGVEHVDKLIYGDKTAYLSWISKVGVIIQDKAIANAEKSFFLNLWDKIDAQ